MIAASYPSIHFTSAGLRLEVFGFTEGCTAAALAEPQGAGRKGEGGRGVVGRDGGWFRLVGEGLVGSDLVKAWLVGSG